MTMDEKMAGGSVSWTCKKGTPFSRNNFASYLVKQGYMQADELRRLLTAVRKNFGRGYEDVEDGYNIFAMDDSDSSSTVFLATKNWHGPTGKEIYGDSYDSREFVVLRKGGEGAILQEKQATNEVLVGTGGRFNFQPLE